MCLVAFQKLFRKIFSDFWLCSWKYHRKHIFYLLLTFSQLPNEYIISFIPKNTNKTQKRSHFLGEIAIAIAIEIGAISIGEIAITISPIEIARSRSTPIGTVPVITIAINADCSLSLALSVFCSRGFFLSVALSLFYAFSGNRLKVKQQCKMISESTM